MSAPALHVTDTDGTGPVKRRRPALSCVECRRRKVKCDRNKPCTPCTRIKSPTCTFRTTPSRRSSPQLVRAWDSFTSHHDEAGSDIPPSSSTSSQHGELDSMGNRYTVSGIPEPRGSLVGDHLPSPHSTAGSEPGLAKVKDFIDQIQELEQRMAGISTHKNGDQLLQDTTSPSTSAAGQFIKSKFYGGSHWYNAIEPYETLGPQYVDVHPETNRTQVNRSSELYKLVLDCKRMARIVKSSRMSCPTTSLEVQALIPEKYVCDQLVECYFRTFEGVFRVLHIPTFRREYQRYWEATAAMPPSVLLKIVLVCALATPFYSGPEKPQLRPSCAKWIQAADSWLGGSHEKSRLNLPGLQIHILMLLAKQTCNIDGDLTWISAGALLRKAMHLGLHRDPSNFPKISSFTAEMRRRLWATTLEITVQTSLDMGMPSMISARDFDTEPPSNINDDDIGEGVSAQLDPKPISDFTQTSVQRAFFKTLHVRLEITRLINNFRSDLSYDSTLRLGKELSIACREHVHMFHAWAASSNSPTPFQTKLFDVLVRRFILSLHRPFFAQARDNPKYYYSRKICLDTSVSILTPASPQQVSESKVLVEDDWAHLTTHSVGWFKSFWLYSITTVYLELLAQIEEQVDCSIPPSSSRVPLEPSQTLETLTAPSDTTVPTTSAAPPPLFDLPPDFTRLRNFLVQAQHTTIRRIENGEANAKGCTFARCVIAKIDALVSGTNADAAVLAAAKLSVEESAQLMRKAYWEEHGVDIDLESGIVAEGEHRGADTGTYMGEEWMNEGHNRADMDWDWEALMQEDGMDLGFGFGSGVGIGGGMEGWFGMGNLL
ncbi:hypothetical protein EJ04DRAFT_28081 [Polyplosphaeria fusca]|uniref:Zn(2)-C6 fungal-type domain-containing protein n=1 Tax=Polyplosphaeria fusca TaxID=682080 RepID=A0A9P4V7W7_9PLEO|nr:hypothetical protein EJ04DRAFT_28081 [Polyplosphaeria fusca]